jgi:hypothetical protein
VYSDIDATCLRSPARIWRGGGGGSGAGFVAWTGDPYWNLSNAVFGFPAGSPVAAAVRACALAHAPTTPHTFIPYVSGPSFFTTAVAQAVVTHPNSKGARSATASAGHPRPARGRHRHNLVHGPPAPAVAAAAPAAVRLLPQALFLTGQAVDGVPPYTLQTNDYNWKEE